VGLNLSVLKFVTWRLYDRVPLSRLSACNLMSVSANLLPGSPRCLVLSDMHASLLPTGNIGILSIGYVDQLGANFHMLSHWF